MLTSLEELSREKICNIVQELFSCCHAEALGSLGSLGSLGAWVLGSGHGHQTHIELASSKRLQKLGKIRVFIGEFNYFYGNFQ
jgi:hypothetical protein